MNKWIIGIVAVLLFAAPAMAQVTISCVVDPEDSCKYYVWYAAPTQDPIIRAFALDVNTGDCNIVDVNDWNEDYWVYPGSIYIEDGEVNEVGAPDANGTDFPLPGTLPGLGSYGVTTEQGSLYVGEGNAPDPCGILFSFTVENCADGNVTISENEARGGIVDEDAGAVASNLPITVPIACSGEPACWSDYGQPCADFTGDNRVNLADLFAIKGCWMKNSTSPEWLVGNPPCVCVDSTRDGAVNLQELFKLKQYWMKNYPPVGSDTCP
jgi:hypothetical protein